MKKTTISGASVDLSPKRKPVQLAPGYHLKLTRLAEVNHREIKGQLEVIIDEKYFEIFPQPVSDQEAIERR